MKTYVHLWQFLAQFFLEWEMFETEIVTKIQKHIFSENRVVYEITWKHMALPDRPQMTI
jgi:hypothetical protein